MEAKLKVKVCAEWLVNTQASWEISKPAFGTKLLASDRDEISGILYILATLKSFQFMFLHSANPDSSVNINAAVLFTITAVSNIRI